MYVAIEPVPCFYIFVEGTPSDRVAGLKIIEDVSLIGLDNEASWPLGSDRPEIFVGQSKTDKKRFQVFRRMQDLKLQDFEFVASNYQVYQNEQPLLAIIDLSAVEIDVPDVY